MTKALSITSITSEEFWTIATQQDTRRFVEGHGYSKPPTETTILQLGCASCLNARSVKITGATKEERESLVRRYLHELGDPPHEMKSDGSTSGKGGCSQGECKVKQLLVKPITDLVQPTDDE